MPDSNSQCGFCSKLGSQYSCPRCGINYCSLKCYRSELHRKCSEDFYREYVVKELKGLKSNKVQNKELSSFEEYMKKYNEEVRPSTSRCQYDDEEMEPLDSDDELGDDLAYLDIVRKETLNEFEKISDNEVERRLTALGVGLEPDQLYAALTEAEKKEFGYLADELLQDSSGIGNTVFKSGVTKNKKS